MFVSQVVSWHLGSLLYRVSNSFLVQLTARDAIDRATAAGFSLAKDEAEMDKIAERTMDGMHTPTGNPCSIKDWPSMRDLVSRNPNKMTVILNNHRTVMGDAKYDKYLKSIRTNGNQGAWS